MAGYFVSDDGLWRIDIICLSLSKKDGAWYRITYKGFWKADVLTPEGIEKFVPLDQLDYVGPEEEPCKVINIV